MSERYEYFCDIAVSLAIKGLLKRRLEPVMWEALRVELQRIYRAATGEEFVTLTVETEPHHG